ncbi:unnamed protein product, partial [Lymnaea stagnalis]
GQLTSGQRFAFPQTQQTGRGPRVLRISREDMLRLQREEAMKQRQRQQQQDDGSQQERFQGQSTAGQQQQQQQPGILANSRLTGSRVAGSSRQPSNLQLARVDPSGRLIPLTPAEREEFLRKGGKIVGQVRPRSDLNRGQRQPQDQSLQVKPVPANPLGGFRDDSVMPRNQMTNSNRNGNENNQLRSDGFNSRFPQPEAKYPMRGNRQQEEQRRQQEEQRRQQEEQRRQQEEQRRQQEERERLIQREKEEELLHQKLIQKKWDDQLKLQRLQEEKDRQQKLLEKRILEQHQILQEQQKQIEQRQQLQATTTSRTGPSVISTQETGPPAISAQKIGPPVISTQEAGPPTISTQKTGPRSISTEGTVPIVISTQQMQRNAKTEEVSTSGRQPTSLSSTSAPLLDSVLASLVSVTHPNVILAGLPLATTDVPILMTSDPVLEFIKPTNQTVVGPPVAESGLAKKERIYQLAELLGFKPIDLLNLVAEMEANKNALSGQMTQTPVNQTAQQPLPSTQMPALEPVTGAIEPGHDTVTGAGDPGRDTVIGRTNKINVTILVGMKNAATTDTPSTPLPTMDHSLTYGVSSPTTVSGTTNHPAQPSFNNQPTVAGTSTTVTPVNSGPSNGELTSDVIFPVTSVTEHATSDNVTSHEAKINELIKQMAVDMLMSRILQSKTTQSSTGFDSQLANELVRLLGGSPIVASTAQVQLVAVDVTTVGPSSTKPQISVVNATPQVVHENIGSGTIPEASTSRNVEATTQIITTNSTVAAGVDPVIMNANNQLASLAQNVIETLLAQTASGALRQDDPLIRAAQALLGEIKELTKNSSSLLNGTRTVLSNMTLDLNSQATASTTDMTTNQSNATLNDTALNATLNDTAVNGQDFNLTSMNFSLALDTYNSTTDNTTTAMETTTTAVPVTEATEAVPTPPPPPPGMPHLFEALPGMANNEVQPTTQGFQPRNNTTSSEGSSPPAVVASSTASSLVQDPKHSLIKSLAHFYGVSLDEADA